MVNNFNMYNCLLFFNSYFSLNLYVNMEVKDKKNQEEDSRQSYKGGSRTRC
jgi:hypothetical protein